MGLVKEFQIFKLSDLDPTGNTNVDKVMLDRCFDEKKYQTIEEAEKALIHINPHEKFTILSIYFLT